MEENPFDNHERVTGHFQNLVIPIYEDVAQLESFFFCLLFIGKGLNSDTRGLM